MHDRLTRAWRHLDFFQYEAWLHCLVPRVKCSACGKTTQVAVPWARPGSSFTALFEALALTLCRQLPVRQAAGLLRCQDKQLWRRIEHYVGQARDKEVFEHAQLIGIDETSLHCGQSYLTVVHDLQAKRLLFATLGRSHRAVLDFVADLKAHDGDPAAMQHVCMDMSAAYALGVAKALRQARISFDRFHVIRMALQAMDDVRRQELWLEGKRIMRAQLVDSPKAARQLMWAMRRSPKGLKKSHNHAIHWLQRANLKSARAWPLKMALQQIYAQAQRHMTIRTRQRSCWVAGSIGRGAAGRPHSRSWLAPCASALPTVVRSMLDGRSNAYVEVMNG